MSDQPLLLRAVDLHKSYQMGKRLLEVLRGISLEVREGEFLALRGASGAGKSTLLHLLGGLDLPNFGEVYMKEQCLSQLPNNTLTRMRNRQVGFVFQAYHLLPELSALENVSLPARILRTPLKQATERAQLLLKQVGLQDRWQHRPYELSGGEQQRVAIARSLINQPALLLADEPTGNLDSHTGDEIIDLLLGLTASHKTTLVMATHDSRIANRAPRQIQLTDGKIAEKS